MLLQVLKTSLWKFRSDARSIGDCTNIYELRLVYTIMEIYVYLNENKPYGTSLEDILNEVQNVFTTKV